MQLLLPHHECFVDRVSQLEGVVTDGQVVLQSERLQHDTISDRERQTQVVTGVTFKRRGTQLTQFFNSVSSEKNRESLWSWMKKCLSDLNK